MTITILSNVAAAATAVTTSRQSITFATTFTTTSATYVDVTGLTVTVANRSGGSAMLAALIEFANNTLANDSYFRWVDNVTNKNDEVQTTFVVSDTQSITIPLAVALSGQVCKIQAHEIGGTATLSVYGTTAGPVSVIEAFEVG